MVSSARRSGKGKANKADKTRRRNNILGPRAIKNRPLPTPPQNEMASKRGDLKKEIARKLFHFAAMSGTVVASTLIYQSFGLERMKEFLMYLLLFVLITEWLVIDVGAYLPFYRELERGKERHRMHGSAYCLIGALLAIEFYSLRIALVATLMVALTDVVTTLVGRAWGRIKICGPKTLEGTMSGLAFNLLIGLAFLPWQIGTAMAIAATVTEAVVNIVDDNLAVPIVAGYVGQMMLSWI